ncbi:hypothetical protein VTH06DRAFT_2441 [Thermothelomyces fergusii]
MSDTEQQQQPPPPPPPLKKYRGNCHCGAFVYEVEVPEIASAGGCNCSMCYKRAYLWLVPQAKPPVVVVRDEGRLVHYSFASGRIDYRFCGKCGTTVMAASDMFPQGVGINARTIQGLDLWSLEVKTFDGAGLDPKYVVPQFRGREPNPAGFENGKTYYGSCHCGAVTTAVRLDGSLEDGTYTGLLLECNCSFCRQGYAWVYPTSEQVAIEGRDNLFYYTFANRCWRKMFCKTCGENIGTELNPDLTEDEVAALPEGARKFRAEHANTKSINLRTINGLDVTRLELVREDGWNNIQPQYVYP